MSTWHGQYLQEGCGGYCGRVQLTQQPQTSTGCVPVTNGELVLATDNEGHVGAGVTDALWAQGDPAARTVYGYASEHSLALVSKALIRAFYGQPPTFSYFDGCSDGGREALNEAQRYPTDFNGIIAGAPALDAIGLVGFLEPWIARVNTDAAGHQILGPDKMGALHTAVMAACAGPDGLIDDPRTCNFNPATLRCPDGQDTPSCLTPAQIGVVGNFYRGPVDKQGHNLYDGGLPYGSELAWPTWDFGPAADPNATRDSIAGQLALNYYDYLAPTARPGQPKNLQDIAFTSEAYAVQHAASAVNDALNPDLSAFHAHGGKIILYHGWADQAIPPFGTVDYYGAVVHQANGYANAEQFSRLYLIPGQYHCLAIGGGDPQVTPDFVTPLMSWVEAGQAPASLTMPTAPGVTPHRTITVTPTNPLISRTATPPGANNNYHWIGRYPVKPATS